MNAHLSDLQLDALRIERRADAHLDSCPLCQARKSTLDQDAALFAERFNPAGLAASALATFETKPKKRPFFVWLAPLAAVAAVAVLFLLPQPPSLRNKGDAVLAEVFVLEGETRVLLEKPVDPRARLAVRLTAEGPRFARILWSSAPESWDALYPLEDAAAWKIDGATWLDRQVVLDGAPETEALGAVACKEPVTHPEAIGMLTSSAREDCTISTVKVEKR
jgi:hypothetical protein